MSYHSCSVLEISERKDDPEWTSSTDERHRELSRSWETVVNRSTGMSVTASGATYRDDSFFFAMGTVEDGDDEKCKIFVFSLSSHSHKSLISTVPIDHREILTACYGSAMEYDEDEDGNTTEELVPISGNSFVDFTTLSFTYIHDRKQFCILLNNELKYHCVFVDGHGEIVSIAKSDEVSYLDDSKLIQDRHLSIYMLYDSHCNRLYITNSKRLVIYNLLIRDTLETELVHFMNVGTFEQINLTKSFSGVVMTTLDKKYVRDFPEFMFDSRNKYVKIIQYETVECVYNLRELDSGKTLEEVKNESFTGTQYVVKGRTVTGEDYSWSWDEVCEDWNEVKKVVGGWLITYDDERTNMSSFDDAMSCA